MKNIDIEAIFEKYGFVKCEEQPEVLPFPVEEEPYQFTLWDYLKESEDKKGE